MNLREFLRQSLVDIVSAVGEAKKENVGIAPLLNCIAGDNPSALRTNKEGWPVFMVEFDIAVTAERDSEMSAEARGSIIRVLSAGADASIVEKHGSVSRVKFSVPIRFN